MPAARATQSSESFARALDFQRETLLRVADQVTGIPDGWLLRTPSLPLVWALNQVRVAGQLDFAALVALGDRHLGALPYRHLVVEDEATGVRLEPEFRAAGWRVECEVTMILADEPGVSGDTSAVGEPAGEEVIELLKRWTGEDQTASGEAEAQLARYWQREFEVRNARLLGIRGRSGALAAITLLYSDAAAAQVENVYTVPDERGRGFARALVTKALELAGDVGRELMFIVADDYDWPKQLYARLAFVPAGRTWVFHRDVR